jgi:hypothetical protein
MVAWGITGLVNILSCSHWPGNTTTIQLSRCAVCSLPFGRRKLRLVLLMLLLLLLILLCLMFLLLLLLLMLLWLMLCLLLLGRQAPW